MVLNTISRLEYLLEPVLHVLLLSMHYDLLIFSGLLPRVYDLLRIFGASGS
jgi:hypothetical protein